MNKDTAPSLAEAESQLGGGLGPVRKEGAGLRLKRHFRTQVRTDHADLLLLSCCVVAGLIDSNVFKGIRFPYGPEFPS